MFFRKNKKNNVQNTSIRELDKNDPRLFTYESPMSGFDPVCHLPYGNPEPWANFLKKKEQYSKPNYTSI